jgi:acyl carrier protein
MDIDQENLLTEKIQTALVEALRVPADQVTPDLAFGDLPQWDSMGHMEVMMCLEQYFGVEINNDTIAGLTSVALIRQHILENGTFNSGYNQENSHD